ncbi:MAG: hypothetical protein ABI831_08750 [Betaproteobacteria bacterium]
MRHHQLEQHASEFLGPGIEMDLLADQLLDQPGLALLHHRLGTRTLPDV